MSSDFPTHAEVGEQNIRKYREKNADINRRLKETPFPDQKPFDPEVFLEEGDS